MPLFNDALAHILYAYGGEVDPTGAVGQDSRATVRATIQPMPGFDPELDAPEDPFVLGYTMTRRNPNPPKRVNQRLQIPYAAGGPVRRRGFWDGGDTGSDPGAGDVGNGYDGAAAAADSYGNGNSADYGSSLSDMGVGMDWNGISNDISSIGDNYAAGNYGNGDPGNWGGSGSDTSSTSDPTGWDQSVGQGASPDLSGSMESANSNYGSIQEALGHTQSGDFGLSGVETSAAPASTSFDTTRGAPSVGILGSNPAQGSGGYSFASPAMPSQAFEEPVSVGTPENSGFEPRTDKLAEAMMPDGWGTTTSHELMAMNPGAYFGNQYPALNDFHPTPQGAAGYLGVSHYESGAPGRIGLNPGSVNSIGAVGLNQHLGDRKSGLLDDLGIDPSGLSKRQLSDALSGHTLGQMAYSLNEIAQGSVPGIGNFGPTRQAMEDPDLSVGQVERAITNNFERPGSRASRASMADRQASARAYEAQLADLQGIGAPAVTASMSNAAPVQEYAPSQPSRSLDPYAASVMDYAPEEKPLADMIHPISMTTPAAPAKPAEMYGPGPQDIPASYTTPGKIGAGALNLGLGLVGGPVGLVAQGISYAMPGHQSLGSRIVDGVGGISRAFPSGGGQPSGGMASSYGAGEGQLAQPMSTQAAPVETPKAAPAPAPAPYVNPYAPKPGQTVIGSDGKLYKIDSNGGKVPL